MLKEQENLNLRKISLLERPKQLLPNSITSYLSIFRTEKSKFKKIFTFIASNN